MRVYDQKKNGELIVGHQSTPKKNLKASAMSHIKCFTEVLLH
jgi:hypothetical protein